MRKHYEARQEYWNAKSIRDGSGGHPTLAAWFTETGQASGHAGFAYIGGELQFDKGSKQWMLNNKSGRFGRRDELAASEVTPQDLQSELDAAAQKIKDCTGLNVVTQLMQ
jgi:hypothetical protein